MRTMLLAAALLALAADQAGARRTTTCCVPLPDPRGGTRPYCFVVRVRPGAIGARRVCRLVGGEPRRAATR
jgi:hypothetical protein